MSQKSFIREVCAQLESQGWRYRDNGKHVVLYPADRRHKPFPIAGSPKNEWQAQDNALKQIRKAGGIID